MGVHPGFSGQEFEGDSIFEKIRQARSHQPKLPIEIDGGVRADLLDRLIDAGVTRICAASLLFSSADPKATLKKLNEMIQSK